MFSIPITIVYRTDEDVHFLPSSISIDELVSINPLDNECEVSVACSTLTDRFPRCVIRLHNGELVVSDHYHDLVRYLDAYKTIEDDYVRLASRKPDRSVRSFSLIEGGMCDSSQASTPASPGQS